MPRVDYEGRREARIERLENRAERLASESESSLNAGRRMFDAIPFGQPLLVDHHSYGRDRRYRNRASAKMEKGFELHKAATVASARATSAESNTAISSDDPEAIVKLREKIADAEADRDLDKADNRKLRKAKLPTAGFTVDDLKAAGVSGEGMKEIVTLKRIGCLYGDMVKIPGYSISNATANIKRMRDRLTSLEKEFARAEEGDVEYAISVAGDSVTVTENVDENRLQLSFPGKPSEAVRKVLKGNGFRWARSLGVWQRLLNGNARGTMRYLLSGRYGPDDWTKVEV